MVHSAPPFRPNEFQMTLLELFQHRQMTPQELKSLEDMLVRHLTDELDQEIEILPEYAEMVAIEASEKAMQSVVSTLMTPPNTSRFDPFFKWQMVETDPDDNKLVYCLITRAKPSAS